MRTPVSCLARVLSLSEGPPDAKHLLRQHVDKLEGELRALELEAGDAFDSRGARTRRGLAKLRARVERLSDQEAERTLPGWHRISVGMNLPDGHPLCCV
jgi:hypothetical protein